MKKFKNILIWLLIATYLIVILGFVASKREKMVCNAFEISISNEKLNKFISKEEVASILSKYKNQSVGTPIDQINTFVAEELLQHHPAVKRADVYTTVDGKLNVYIKQRRPILRVITRGMQNYYIDENGEIIPRLKQFAAFTVVANGNIAETFNPWTTKTLFPDKRDSVVMKKCIVHDLFKVAQFLDNSTFWNAQIQQIYVNSKQDMVLIPRVGSHLIVIGNADSLEYKFDKLRAMYRAFNEIGWNNYHTLNLKYSNQIICTKR